MFILWRCIRRLNRKWFYGEARNRTCDPGLQAVFVAVFLSWTSTGRVSFWFLWFYVQELPKAQLSVVLVLKRLRRRVHGLKSHPTDFLWLSLGSNQYRREGLWFVCLLYDGSTRRLTESGFMEKPGIEPATPGLQGIALIHYTTGASLFVAFPG